MRFEDIVDTEGLGAEDEARLRHVHDLLLQAGPPPDLSPGLNEAPSLRPAEDPPEVAFLFRRRRGLAVVLALAAAIAAFAGGYAFGHSRASTSFQAERLVPMHGHAAGQLAVLKIAKADSVGNWPMELTVRGLPTQAARGAYYELWLTRGGKPVVPCGTFRVTSKTTTVRLSVPYSFHGQHGWVVTVQPANDHGPGPVVLTT